VKVGALIGLMIAIVVGVCLISPITEATKQATDVATVAGGAVATPSSAESALLGILPIVIVVVIILGAISWMAFAGDRGTERREKVVKVFNKVLKNPRELILQIEKASQQWGEYINNLDALLGLETINSGSLVSNLELGQDRVLRINDHDYDWYITYKRPAQDMFKVVGLHKKDASKNLVYLLGKNGQTEQPYLIALSVDHMFADFEHCLDEVTSGARELLGIEPARELVGVRASKKESTNFAEMSWSELSQIRDG
jgi:hypothetical protein